VKSGDVHIAYQVVGQGALDLVFVPGFVSHVDYIWEDPVASRCLDRLASFSRLILFDKRGTGLSDRTSAIFTLEQRMDDVRAVMDAVGSSRAALFGISEGGPMSILYAATYPQRTTALIIYGSYARRSAAPDHPFGPGDAQWDALFERMEREWGGPMGIDLWVPSAASDDRFRNWWTNYLKLGASPGAAITIMRMNREIDVRHVLPSVHVPSLILHRTGDRNIRVEQARYLAERIPGARLVELPGNNHWPWAGDAQSIVDEIEEFLTGARPQVQADRALATVLFVDIVESTQRAVALGDAGWRDLLASYHAHVDKEVTRYRGQIIDTAGDGVLATFDGPARAIRCAEAIRSPLSTQGLTVRAGLHTGECEIVGGKVIGIAVHTAARVSTAARPGEILVSSTVRDLVAGSGLSFSDRGLHALKGVPGEWRLFAAQV
jgi:class 3 adenylate cyclase